VPLIGRGQAGRRGELEKSTAALVLSNGEDRIDGVVITCADISATKKLEAELRARRKAGNGVS